MIKAVTKAVTKTDELAKTPLAQWHQQRGAKMVPFAGYLMPVQYKLGIIKEHLHTRANAGLFDVSHMGQLLVRGADSVSFLESLMPADFRGLAVNRQKYSVLTLADGGIQDDLMVANLGDHWHVVINAARKTEDLAHMRQYLTGDVDISVLNDRSLLALQGPQAAEVLKRYCPDVAAMVFMDAKYLSVNGVECLVTRSGYTGEDGFEISVANDQVVDLAETLIANTEVEAIGLGARDSLRLEAGLCLYGHDIDEQTTIVEAGLSWVVNKARRASGCNPGGFPGAETTMRQLAEGASRQRIGLAVEGRAPIREGAEILDENGKLCGRVTSGGFAPSLSAPIAMGYVDSHYAALGTQLSVIVRNKSIPVTVTSMPFVKPGYVR